MERLTFTLADRAHLPHAQSNGEQRPCCADGTTGVRDVNINFASMTEEERRALMGGQRGLPKLASSTR
jgi:hypothetical protein